MLLATIKADIVKHIHDATAPLVDEVKLQVSKDGLSIRAVDPAHVAMVDISIGAKAFESYEADNLEIGLDMDKLKDILKLAGGSDVMKLEYNKESHRLVFTIGNLVRRMSLLDTAGMPDPKVPNLNLPNKVVVKTEELMKAVKGAEAVSDFITVVSDPEYFEVIAESEMDSMDLRIAKEDLTSIEAAERAKSMFSIDYFSNMVKAAKPGNDVTLNLGSDYPVKLEFDMAEGNGHCVYLLAPRIEND